MKKLFWASLISGGLSFGLFIFVFVFCPPVVKTNAQDVFEYIEEHQIINVPEISFESQKAYSNLKLKLINSEIRLKRISWLLFFLSSAGFLILSIIFLIGSIALRRHNQAAQKGQPGHPGFGHSGEIEQ